MKKFFGLLMVLALGLATTSDVNANNYRVDDLAIEQLFAASADGNVLQMSQSLVSFENYDVNSASFAAQQKSAVIAFVLSWALGYLGIHRLYLGTSGGTFILYLLTCGGFGILATIDWVLLLIGLINDDISRYVGNRSVFMWSN